MRHRIFFGVLTAAAICWSATPGQDREFYKQPTNVPEYWKALQFEIAVGKYEIAAAHLLAAGEIHAVSVGRTAIKPITLQQ